MSSRPRRSTASSLRSDDSHRRPYTRAMSSSATYTRSANNPPLDFSAQEKDTSGCYACRFRKKKCVKAPSADRCVDCDRFNILCNGQGSQRPSGPGIAAQVRQLTKKWIGTKNKKEFAPLDLATVWREAVEPSTCKIEEMSPRSEDSSDEDSPDPEYEYDSYTDSPGSMHGSWADAHPQPEMYHPDPAYAYGPDSSYDPFRGRYPYQEYEKPYAPRVEPWAPSYSGPVSFGYQEYQVTSSFVSPHSLYDASHQDGHHQSTDRYEYR